VIALPPASSAQTAELQDAFEAGDFVDADVTASLRTELGQNYPNPFNPATTIKFSLAEPQNVTLSVFNVRGQLVSRLIDGEQMAIGPHTVPFVANDLASGVYFYRLEAGSYVEMKKMVLMK
jgi:hypothetical protein